mmetsp:Transcript_8559/g.25228  ORF Transcript_8559/g.25228 Transcript_8559/m.25228 type:complete len:164 (+) Transcript_8559:253-744(+)
MCATQVDVMGTRCAEYTEVIHVHLNSHRSARRRLGCFVAHSVGMRADELCATSRAGMWLRLARGETVRACSNRSCHVPTPKRESRVGNRSRTWLRPLSEVHVEGVLLLGGLCRIQGTRAPSHLQGSTQLRVERDAHPQAMARNDIHSRASTIQQVDGEDHSVM